MSRVSRVCTPTPSSFFPTRAKSVRSFRYCSASSYGPEKKQNHDSRHLSWLEIRLIIVTHAAPNGMEGRYRDMADSASYAGCGQRGAAQRHRWARANEHIATTKPRGREAARIGSESILKNLRARPGRRSVSLEYRGPGRASARHLHIPRAGPGAFGPAGRAPAPSARFGPTRKDPCIKNIAFLTI